MQILGSFGILPFREEISLHVVHGLCDLRDMCFSYCLRHSVVVLILIAIPTSMTRLGTDLEHKLLIVTAKTFFRP
jgi:hypothetical protein